MELRSLMLCEYLKGSNQPLNLKVGNKKMGTISVGNAHCLLQWSQVLYMWCLIYHFQIEFLKCTLLRHLLLNSKKTLYNNLKKEEVVQELHERKVSFTCKLSAKDLQELLIKEMYGIQRLPALLFQNPTDNLDQFCLQHYETLNNEPLHDVSHHIWNLSEEIPNHLPKDFKQSLKKKKFRIHITDRELRILIITEKVY